MQRRPDAAQSVEGHGPYIKMYWENIPENGKFQYKAQPGMYHGSKYDGAGDPFVGWADYDFGSIMHYGEGYPKKMDTIPQGHVIGQRSALSPGDVLMLNDLYQCRTKGATAMPTPSPTPPTPTPTKEKPDAYEWWVKDGPCVQSEDLSCITSPNSPSAYSSSQKCDIDVKN